MRSSLLNSAIDTIKQVLQVGECSIYWFPTLTEARRCINTMAVDSHRILFIANADTTDGNAELSLPVDLLVTHRGEIGVHNSQLYLMGRIQYDIKEDRRGLISTDVERVQTAVTVIADFASSRYWQRVEEGKTEWKLSDAQIVRDFSFLGKEREDTDAVIYHQKER